ncbi:MAG: MauE/DoxX family redox-associated membrane protein [Tepidisphaeraceae bacterium]
MTSGARSVSRAALTALRLALGALLVYGGGTKILSSYQFLDAVYSYELTGIRTGAIIAAWLPWLELLTGALLLVGPLRAGAALGAVLLGGVFVGAQSTALYRGIATPCGCFGSHEVVDAGTLLRAVAVLIVATVLLIDAVAPVAESPALAPQAPT